MSPKNLRDLCQAIVSALDHDDNMRQEISMWRERFLQEKEVKKIFPIGDMIHWNFMAMPCDFLRKNTPEETLEILHKNISEANPL